MKQLLVTCLLLLPFGVQANEPDPADQFLDAYFLIQKGDSAFKKAEWLAAYRSFEPALEKLQNLRSAYPDWNPNVIEFRIDYCRQQLADLKPRIPAEALAPPPPPVPVPQPVVATLPAGEAQQRIDNLTARLDEAQQQIQKLEAGRTDLQAKLQQALANVTPAETTLRVEEILEENKKLSAALAEGQQQIKNLTGQVAELLQARDRVRELEASQARLTADLAQATARAGTAEDDRDLNQDRLAQLLQQNELLTAQLAAAREEVALLKEQGSPVQAAEIIRLREQLAEAVAEMERSQQTLTATQTDLAALRGQLEGVRAENAQLQGKLQQATGRIATLEMAGETDDEVILYLRKENALLKELANRSDVQARMAAAEPSRSLWTRLFGPAAAEPAEPVEPPRVTTSQSEKLAAELTATKMTRAAQPNPRPQVPAVFETRSADHQAWLQEAAGAEQAGERDRAVALYRRVLEADPDNLLALSNLGVIQYHQGDLQAAETTTRRAVALAPNDSEARALLGIIYFRSGKIEEAFSELTRAIAIDPRHAQAHNFLGITLSEKGWNAAAEQEIRRAIELDPRNADAHFNLAVLYAGERTPKYELARHHYRKAVDLGAAKDAALEELLARSP